MGARPQHSKISKRVANKANRDAKEGLDSAMLVAEAVCGEARKAKRPARVPKKPLEDCTDEERLMRAGTFDNYCSSTLCELVEQFNADKGWLGVQALLVASVHKYTECLHEYATRGQSEDEVLYGQKVQAMVLWLDWAHDLSSQFPTPEEE